MKSPMSFLALMFLFALAAPSARADATAAEITSPSALLPGTNAQGILGDWLLANNFVRVVIDDIPNPHGFANTGGNILDAATATGEDRFASMFTMFDNRFGRQANYASLTIVNAGGGANVAQIRSTGVDSSDPNLAVQTDYFLGPNDRAVRIATTLTNNGATPVTQLQVGDAVQWGLTDSFAPNWANTNRNVLGDGYDIGGQTFNANWVAADGQGSAYGVTVATGQVEVTNGSTWSDTNVTYLDLQAGGGSGSYERFFVVGARAIAAVSDAVFAIRGTATGTLSGTVIENVTGLPIADAAVVVNTTACLGASGSRSSSIARTDAAGQFAANLEPGTYFVLFQATGRSSSACQTVSITAGNTTPLNQTLSRQGILAWNVRDANSNPIPAKISVLYDPLTAKLEGPNLGDARSLIGGYAILSASGSGSTAVPPGSYRVYVSRGVEYEPVIQSVTVTEAGTTSVSATMNRVVASAGWISGDLHVHGFNSADSAILWEDRARQAAAEGLEIVVPTDHDYISEMASAVASTGTSAWVGTFPGDEVTTNTWGHFNGFPLTLAPGQPGNGALDHAGLAPSQIFAGLRADPKDPVVQINHPRAGGLGYFDLSALNPVTGTSANPDWSLDFDAVEVFNGKRLYQVRQTINDWHRLLNNGKRVTAVGNTDTHAIFGQELGYPRNFVASSTDDPASVSDSAFRDALKEGKSFLTNGPFVETWVNNLPIGSLVADADGSVDLRIRVQAPAWFTVDTVDVYVNGQIGLTVNPSPASGVVLRLDQTYPITVTKDSWIAVEVRGGQCETTSSNACVVAGCPGRLDPIVPPLYGTDPVCPFALTNPIYVDTNGSGVFDAPGNQGLEVEPISQVRPADGTTFANLREGEVVTVRGVVSAGSYTFDHRSNTVYFQDASFDDPNNRSAGTTIYQNGLISPILVPGDEIQVTGTLAMFNGLLEMTGVATQILRCGAPVPDPTVLTIGQLVNSANREQWEGMLVRVNGASLTGGTWPGFGVNANLTINDGTGSMTMRVDSDTDSDGTVAPSGTFDVIGVIGQFDSSSPFSSGYQLLPRQRIDIVEAGAPMRILHSPAADAVSACGAVIRWYTNKAGDSVVDYGTTPALGLTASDPTPVAAHAVVLSGLAASTTYYFRAVTNGVASAQGSFTTAAGAIPQIVTGPVVSLVDTTSAQVTWTTDLSSTSVVRFGPTAALGSTATGPSGTTLHWATLTGLEAGSTMHYQVESASTACGGGAITTVDATFDTPTLPAAPPEVSGPSAAIPFTLSKSGAGVDLSFEYRGTGFTYSIYGAASDAQIDAGAWSTRICDLENNPEGTFVTDGATWITFTLADGSALPEGRYVVIASSGGVEGPYGRKSSGDLRRRDLDGDAPTEIGCPVACTPATATIVSVAPSATVTQGTQQTFTGSGSGTGALTYEWDFDYVGSVFTVDATGSAVNHTYSATGSYSAALRVTDSCANPTPQQAIDSDPITIQGSGGCSGQIVISQMYGGGGNSGATYRNDFIELFNRGGQAVNVSGWSVQYASATGTTWQVTTLSGSIPAGGYYLVQQAAGAGGTTNLPTPDATGSIAMSSTAGKVALVTSNPALSGSCPIAGAVDFAGYGATANCFEGTGPTPAPSNTTSVSRAAAGCVDANANNTDFSAGAVNPRNAANATNLCGCP